MTDLATWLLEQIAEDERLAHAAARLDDDEPEDPDWDTIVARLEDAGWDEEAARRLDRHVVNWDPARVLAECYAKRQMIDEHLREAHDDCFACEAPWPCKTMRLLALPYQDRRGFREEWRV